MSSLGHIAIVGAFALSLYAASISLWGARRGGAAQVMSGQNALAAVTALYSVAAFTLIAAFVTHDFSLRYVWDHSSRAMSADLVLAAFYSGQQGSLLYWGWTLSLFAAVVLWQQRKPGPHRLYMPYVVAVLSVILGFMALLLGFVASPFERLPQTPPDGVGLNPLLYDPGMRIHPPMLLGGLMSWSVPFAFAIAAMATGRLGNEWIAIARRYAMFAWVVLGLGNLLGAWWAYHVLGWGGYWGWDPVENVAFMPWLTGTAFIHSIQIQERRGMLKAWNLALILITFFLSIFGTFVVRSGVLSSVHAFALSAIGPYFLAYLGLFMAGSLALFIWRLPSLHADNQLDSLLSREASFLLNNVLFLGITFAIFWGTIYPLIAEAINGSRVSVGPPYFQQVVGPLFGGLLLLMGVAPLLPWRKTARDLLVRNFSLPVGATFGGLVLLFAVGVRNTFALVGFALCLFVLATILQEFGRGTAARHQATGEGMAEALFNLVRRNNRRYGGYLVHVGIVLIGGGIIGSQVYQQSAQATLKPGQSMAIGGYTIRAQGLQTVNVPGARVDEAPVLLGDEILHPQKVFFDNFPQEPSTKVAVRATPLEDLYVVLSGWDGSGPSASVSLSVFVNPLVSWIWTGGIVLLLGTMVALWPATYLAPRGVSVRVPSRYLGLAR